MNPDERTLMLLAGAALAALILWRTTAPFRVSSLTVATGGTPIQAAGYSQVPTPELMANGPDYLIANAPWFYTPAVGNVMPSTTVGQVGQVSENPSTFSMVGEDCGCY